MMTFGMMMDMFPMTGDSEFPLENHQEWMTQRLQLESVENTTNQKRLILPGPTGVTMGRDWEAQMHPGIMRLRDVIIARHWDAYDNAKKLEKTMIRREIVQEVKAAGNRFLKSDGAGHCVLVGDTAAREKVSSSFRDRRKKADCASDGARKRPGFQTESRCLDQVSTASGILDRVTTFLKASVQNIVVSCSCCLLPANIASFVLVAFYQNVNTNYFP
jgi:hypothetical protein